MSGVRLCQTSRMLRYALICSMYGILVSSQKIILTINASSYIEGQAAELSCNFPPSFTGPLSWMNIDKVDNVKSEFICKLKSCKQIAGYHVSRVGNNLTLVINKLNKKAKTWECSNLFGTLTEMVILDIKANSPLKITITPDGSGYKITSSCSSLPIEIECFNGDEKVEIDLQSSPCLKPKFGLEYIGIVKPDLSSLKCTARRNDETAVASYTKALTSLYYIGGSITAVGITVAIISLVKSFLHVGIGGISIILAGVAILVYNHSIEVFITLAVLSVLVLFGDLLHMFIINKSGIYRNPPENGPM